MIMVKFKKAYNSSIILTVITIVVLLSTQALYSFPSSAETLRLPIGQLERMEALLNKDKMVYIVKEIDGKLVIISEMPRYLAEEKGLGYNEEKGVLQYANETDSSLEFIDIIGIDESGNEKVIGKTLRKKGISDLAHEKGFLHRTANAFVITPRGEIVIDRRAHNKAQPLRLSILGGHVPSGGQYRETIKKELPEELGFPEGWLLQGKFVTIGKEGGFAYNDGKNNERRDLEVYILSEKEYQMVMQGKQRMDDGKGTKTEAEYKATLEEKQMLGKGGGEVWGRYVFDITMILSSERDSEGPYIELLDKFKGSEKKDKVRFTADLLQPLLEDKQVMGEITRVVQEIHVQNLLRARNLLDKNI